MLCLNILNESKWPRSPHKTASLLFKWKLLSTEHPYSSLYLCCHSVSQAWTSMSPKSQEDYRTWYLHLESEGLLPYADGWPKCLLSAVLLQIFGPKDLLKISKKLPHFNHSLPLTAVICQHAGAPFVPPSQLGCFGPSCNEWIEVQTRRPYKLHHAASTTTCVWFHNNSS